jgi:hypothetical protein
LPRRRFECNDSTGTPVGASAWNRPQIAHIVIPKRHGVCLGVITVDTARWPTTTQVAVVRDIAIHVVPEDHLVSGSVNASVPVGTTT